MGIKSKFKTWFFLDDNYEDEYEAEYDEPVEYENTTGTPRFQQQKKNVVSLQSIKSSSKLVLVEPRVFNDAQEIADHLKNRRTVVVNLQRVEKTEARRIVDFLSGTVYAIGGEIQKIGSYIVLCTPDNVEVTGAISDAFINNNFEDTRW
ncbi:MULTISPECIES: cell division protein SepF [Bacillaceae]|uniref:cell division protein SepF n=1 Tax=Bacillaceae TaxID=186817 RepID=UPI001D085335|nr:MULTISPECIES: cell division protein SepF [Caldibacillus]MCB7068582.1 cell division protein SepF [Caldibacillus sp. 210928-DFI.2.22]MCB7072017.1 cell division protein SepF [Caldibacillus sp. 210928-DFI.2.18]MCM3054942.1 cell division protein SepF [Caldibacillus thermoamylovorans]MDL0418542.1 cell division protein SepF [Caldibacillus thermoamylovorans]